MKRIALVLGAAFVLASSAAYAEHDGRMEKRTHRDSGDYRNNMPKRTQKDYRLRSGEYRRDGSIFDRYGNVVGTYGTNRRAVPPGLAKKPGGMPPGQWKKQMRDGYYR